MKPREGIIPSKSVMGPEAGPLVAGGKAAPAAGGGEAQAEERELVRRAQTGDEAAFRLLVERHGPRAHALALRILRSPSDAEEVAQDALVRAWRALPRFRGEAAFGSWLHRIVARRAFDRVAVLKARRLREMPVESAEDLPHAAPGPDPGAGTNARKLERLLAELPEVP